MERVEKVDPGALAHITDGRDRNGVEWTKCGLQIRPEDFDRALSQQERAATAGRWCQRCEELDG
jgi:hypothetical protein